MTRTFALILVLAAAAPASADVKWIGAGVTDNWTNPNNWLGARTPGADDVVRFAGSHARTYSDVNENFSIVSVVFEYDDVLGSMVGRSYTVGGTGVLTIRDRIFNSTDLAQTVSAPIRLANGASVGTASGYTGSLTLGAINLDSFALLVSASSGGINFNGPITSSGTSASISIAGDGITRFNAASSWTGRLNIGGTVEYASGPALGSTGVIVGLNGTLRRTTSGINVLNVQVGNGTLDVPAGLTVTHTGTFSGSNATLNKTGAGTLVLTNTASGFSQLNVAGRMRLESLTSFSGAGVAIASGATLEYARTPDETFRTLSGTGTLQLNAGGRIQVGSGTTFPGAGQFDGSIQGANAQFAKAGTGLFELRGASTYSGGTTVLAGTLLANNTAGSATGTGAVTVSGNSTLGGDGAVAGVVTLQNLAVLAPSARGTPGQGLGSLELGGLHMQAGSVLQIELGAGGASDLLNINGDVSLNGTLALSRLGNLILTDELPRRVLSATGTISGSFQSITGQEQSPTAWFAVVFGPGTVDVVRARAGDTSLDGSVSFSDLVTIAGDYGQTSGRIWLTGDFNGDGATDLEDLLLASPNYSPLPGSSFEQDWIQAQAVAVPEPTPLALFAAGAAMLALLRGRQARHTRPEAP